MILHLSGGEIHAVSNEDTDLIAQSLGCTFTKRRASHVWPCHPVKRTAFRLLRLLFGERGNVASWCRNWRGPWEVRFAENKHRVVFTHASRRVCINWEIEQLNQQLSDPSYRSDSENL